MINKIPEPKRSEILLKIQNILSDSDIVWPRYGNDTTGELAIRILKKIEEKED